MVARALYPAAVCLLATVLGGITAPAVAQTSVLATIGDLEPGDLEVRGFELEREQKVSVEALALDPRKRGHKSFELADAWILNARSREVVWSLEGARSPGRRGEFREVDEELRLDAGSYEVYYATFPKYQSDDWGGGWWESAARSMARMFGWGDEEDYEEAIGDLRMVVRGDGRALDAEDMKATRAQLREGAVVALEARGNNASQVRGFRLEQPVEVLIYAVGELDDDGGYDYGWIIDAESRKKVWTFTWKGSDRAGGAKKNRVAHDTVSLPAGAYAAYFVTDGSHSPGRWNNLPPHDPAFWGLTLWPKDPQQLRSAKDYAFRHLPEDDQIIVEIAPMRDDDHRSEGFRLEQPMHVRIHAVGEGDEHRMADYGWIIDARTRRKVWTMEWKRSEHAGGAKKNRVVDEVIELEAGSYIATFLTDGSHAYRDWNSSPPTYPERWGITVFGDEGFDRSAVTAYLEEDDSGVLARIARVKSHRQKQIEFTVERDAEVSVYALGEGTDGRDARLRLARRRERSCRLGDEISDDRRRRRLVEEPSVPGLAEARRWRLRAALPDGRLPRFSRLERLAAR